MKSEREKELLTKIELLERDNAQWKKDHATQAESYDAYYKIQLAAARKEALEEAAAICRARFKGCDKSNVSCHMLDAEDIERAAALTGPDVPHANALAEKAKQEMSDFDKEYPFGVGATGHAEGFLVSTPTSIFEEHPGGTMVARAASASQTVEHESQIKHMVNRFLGWRLPENFNPDGGISFKPMRNEGYVFAAKNEPVGTNLFDAMQAEEMVRYMVDGLPAAEHVASVTKGRQTAPEDWTDEDTDRVDDFRETTKMMEKMENKGREQRG
jgi:hypothetical protein